MLYLFLAIVCASTYSVLFKLFACRDIDSLQAIAFNYITATILGFSMSLGSVSNGLVLSLGELGLSAVMGVMFMAAFVLMARSTASSGVAVTTIAARVSLIIPVVLSYLFLSGEAEPRWWAIVIILVALVMVIMQPTKGKSRRGLSSWWLPLGVFLLFGANNFCLNWAKSGLNTQGGEEQLSAVIFLFAAIASCGYYLTRKHRKSWSWRAMVGGVVLGVSNFFTTYFMLLGLGTMSSGVFFPIYHVGIVALVTTLGVLLFRERISKVQFAGMVVAAIGIVAFFI